MRDAVEAVLARVRAAVKAEPALAAAEKELTKVLKRKPGKK